MNILNKINIITTIITSTILLILLNQDNISLIQTFNLECEKVKCKLTATCADNQEMCPTPMSCPNNFIKCDMFTCTNSPEKVCVEKKCPKITCWDNSCVDDFEQCPSIMSCPNNLKTRCFDNSCVSQINDCGNYEECPKFIKVRCPNGDCRRSLNDCPSTTKCTKNFPILCNDGSCKTSKNDCEKSAQQTQCVDRTMTRCSDGSCSPAKFLCPTLKACPLGMVLCYHGNCAESYSECENLEKKEKASSCFDLKKVRCAHDNSCVDYIKDCPTSYICPLDKPVKCWDGSCKEAINKCPIFEKCPQGTFECPDGSCTNKSCGTHITCSREAPFKCADNTCRMNRDDCPRQKQCTLEKPFLCWDNTCVARRGNCKSTDICPSISSVKCPDNTCRGSLEECKAIEDCPTGFIRCLDGSCNRSLSSCEEQSCPLNFNHKCKNGQCVTDEKYCDTDTGCTYDKPFRCQYGQCVADKDTCSDKSLEIKCDNGEQPCEDGSCRDIDQCPVSNGCPKNLKYKCADGSCIDDKKHTCPIPICPQESPIKCLNGLCVNSSSDCKSKYKTDIKSFFCADGSEVLFPEHCKPTFKCSMNKEKCDDGTCRLKKEYCPKFNTCPSKYSYRCSNGLCAENEQMCLNTSGCNKINSIKCPNTGLCVNHNSECNDFINLFPLANGCTFDKELKCTEGYVGKCVFKEDECKINHCISDEKTPYFCKNNGRCVDNLRNCGRTNDCGEGEIKCPTDKSCKKSLYECKNKDGCPLGTPYRCLDGTCKKYSTLYSYFKGLNEESCPIGISCPNYKPYLCSDGSCTEKASFCEVDNKCSEDKPYRCFDRSCNTEECIEKFNKCPHKNPILCPNNGNCVSTVFDCFDEICPQEKPLRCIDGTCTDIPRVCVDKINGLKCKDEEFLCLDGSCMPKKENCPVFPGCDNPLYPYKAKNGSCQKTLELAEINSKEKNSEGELIDIKCDEGLLLCEDGICRKECPAYNGCPNKTPLQCSNGFCVKQISECAGLSNCSLDKPFRCVDGSCVESISNCNYIKKNHGSLDLTIFSDSQVKLSTDIIVTNSNDVIGRLTIPPNSFMDERNSTIDSTVIKVRSIPTSELVTTKAKYNQTREDDIQTVFPYGDKENEFFLEFEYSVLSPVIDINIPDNDVQFRNYVVLSLAYDFNLQKSSKVYIVNNIKKDDNTDDNKNTTDKNSTNSTNTDDDTNDTDNTDNKELTDEEKEEELNKSILNPLKDVCLGLLNKDTKIFTCVESNQITNYAANLEFHGGILKSGIYAVILDPKPDNDTIQFEPNFIMKYFLALMIGIGVTLIIITIGIYVFLRIFRYKQKYKETRENTKLAEIRMQEMQNIGTNYHGQTLGDNLDNIIYTNNACYKVERVDEKSARVLEIEDTQMKMMVRLKQLENNENTLIQRKEDMLNEIERLKEYRDE